MQSRAFIRAHPGVCRVVKTVPITTSRGMSVYPRSFGFGGFPVVVQNPFAVSPLNGFDREIAPLFRIMDDLSRTFEQQLSPSASSSRHAAAPFVPRFDVKEVDGAYELRGELPGVEASNLQVEFTDPQTLVIRGKTESETNNGTPSTPATIDASTETAKAIDAGDSTTITEQDTSMTNASASAVDASANDDAASTHSGSTSSYQKATVEDENAAAPSTPGDATPAESTVAEAKSAQPTTTAADNNAPSSRFWMSERRTGSFQRVFSFSERVDQEAVTASLKNGILNVVVPKAHKPEIRRIEVQ